MILDPILDIFRGKAITVPPLDGAFRANEALEDAAFRARLPEPDNLVWWQGRAIVASGADLVALDDAGPEVIERAPAPVTAADVSPAGELAFAVEGGGLFVGGRALDAPKGVACITALAHAPDGTLWLANGSDRHAASGWVADLMEKNASGSVWRRIAERWEKVAGGLAWPYGLLPDGKGAIVSESWRHRLIRVGDRRDTVLPHLPGYPARLARSSDGGAWLALFAPRNRLIELVLREHHYRLDMMAEVPREFWIAPALSAGRSFLEPLQCGGIVTLGIHKPWAPSRSYGLVVRLDAQMAPVSSLHSRANGRRHGVTSVLEAGGRLLVAAKGGDEVLEVAP
jgi:hypothetical protein